MNEHRQPRFRAEHEHRHLCLCVGPGEPCEFPVAVRGGGCREDLERDGPRITKREEGGFGQLDRCREHAEIGQRAGGEMVATQGHPFGGIAARVGDRHLEKGGDAALCRRAGL